MACLDPGIILTTASSWSLGIHRHSRSPVNGWLCRLATGFSKGTPTARWADSPNSPCPLGAFHIDSLKKCIPLEHPQVRCCLPPWPAPPHRGRGKQAVTWGKCLCRKQPVALGSCSSAPGWCRERKGKAAILHYPVSHRNAIL